jgi:cobyrinic acid a,c-diamide synthase
MAELQTPWSVSGPAVAATLACLTDEAAVEAGARAATIAAWRADLQQALEIRGIEHVPSSTSFVLARPGEGVHAALRARGIAVRRADTFPGLDDTWIRIAVRGPATTARLLAALDAVRPLQPTA